ncbi:MAG: universal stress protein [Pseudomonadota bacterium]|nr:universal stress protein [Pseudomonadota bacterium]
MNILLPVDGSAGALVAVRHVLGLARAGLPVRALLVNVQEPASLYEMVTAHDAGVIAEVSARAAAHSLAPAEDMLRLGGIEFDTRIAHGSPGQVLVELAAELPCDAVVMGARGQDEFETGSLGSVAEFVVKHTPVAVTIVKRTGPA